MQTQRITWPEGKRFAFTIFDDPDAQTLHQAQEVYGFLADQGLRTTAGVWTLEPGAARRNSPGETCANPQYLAWMQELQQRGFEVGTHHVAPASMTREEIVAGLDAFRGFFGDYPVTMANHYNAEAIYWGDARLNGWLRTAYRLATRGSTSNRFFGEHPGRPEFWGDLCRDRIRYCRNFVFRDLNTLNPCPMMPYHDHDRPYVNQWYASSEASNVQRFHETVTEASLDRLEEEGGAAILYTHFGHGYTDARGLDPRFRALIERVAQRNGWFVPVKKLLMHLETQGNGAVISRSDRDAMARRWLVAKLRHGTS